MRYRKIGYYENDGTQNHYIEDLKLQITPTLFLEDKYLSEHVFKNWIERKGDYLNNYANFCRNFEKIKEKGLGMILGGDCGTGKTFAIDCIYNALKERYVVCKTSISHILTLIKKGMTDNSYSTTKLIKDLLKIDLLILDDVGNEKIDSSWAKEIMFVIFDTLYRNKKSFIITTNFNLTQLKEYFIIDGSPKIFDRIREICKSFNYNGLRNMRYQKNEKHFKELM